MKRIGLSIYYRMNELAFLLYLKLNVSKRMSDIKMVKIGYKIPEIRQKIEPKI